MGQPAFKARDGALEITVWANTSDKGIFYSTDLKRSFMFEEEWKDTTSMGKQNIGAAIALYNLAYVKISELEAEAKAAQPASE